MQGIIVKGGARLKGEVPVSGAKNAALPIMAATLLAPGTHHISNVPVLSDVQTMQRLLAILGARCTGKKSLTVRTGKLTGDEAPYDLVKTMRASILVLGPLVARAGHARVSLPGGCAIGERPVNLHLKGLEALGARISLEHGYIDARARRLTGARIFLERPTVTGTENLMMAASLADGATIIENAAREPEVVDLARALTAMGGRLEGAGTDTILIEGVTSLRPLTHTVMPDRIEAGTLMVAAAITGGEVTVRGVEAGHCTACISKLCEAGARVEEIDGGVKVTGPPRPRSLDVKTGPYPEFPTDMQAQFMALMSVSRGLGVITETVFENRFVHAAEMKRMGADVTIEGNYAVVRGRPGLSAAEVMATDLRASASLVLAALRAKGETRITRVYHLDRGYERLDRKLAALGAIIKRCKY